MKELKDKLLKGEVGTFSALLEIVETISKIAKKVSDLEERQKSIEKALTSSVRRRKPE